MSKPVGVLGVNQLWDELPYRHIKTVEASTGCRTRRFRVVKGESHRPTLVQEIAGPTTDGALGVGNALPFSRISKPLIAPSKLHYEIPHAGDVGYMRHYRPLIHVSGRLAPEIRALECVPLPKRAEPDRTSSA